MTLGERIASLRKEKGLSQEALGELVGVTRQAVSKWEADKTLFRPYSSSAARRSAPRAC